MAWPALGALEGAGVNQFLRAARAKGRIRLDGRLDEPGWQAAPAFEFVNL